MNWFLSIVVGFLTGTVGLLAVGFLGNLNTRWYRISSFEGGAGYYVLMFALLGGVVGCVVGIVGSRVVAGWPEPGFLKALGVSVGTMVTLTVAVGLVCRLAADIRPTIDGRTLDLAIEVRAPRGFTPDFASEPGASPYFYLMNAGGQTKAYAPIEAATAIEVDGRWVFSGALGLATSASGKRVRAYFNKAADALFILPLAGRPTTGDLVWSEWIQSGWDVGQPRPGPEQSFWLRYRVVIDEPPVRGPTQAEVDARRAAEAQAVFDAIPEDAALSVWLPYTRYGTPEPQLRAAITRIQARPHLAAELEPLVTGDDHEIAAAALRMIGQLDVFDPGLDEPVGAAGQRLIAMTRIFNATPLEDDPGMQGAADISVRFSAWMEAVRTLRDNTGGDFTAELGGILTLSRVREDSHCMRMDVRRVASYYMKEWTGLDPLPGDPKPR